MKSFILICLFGLSAVAFGEMYTDRYDNINIEEIKENPRLLDAYQKCLMETGSCTAEGTELKKYIIDALQTECDKCTEQQKIKIKSMIKHLINKEPAKWEELCGKYDPGNVYRTKYEKEMKEL